MSVAEQFSDLTAPGVRKSASWFRQLWWGGAAALVLTRDGMRAILAGMRASKEYRHLNGMSDRRLRMLGLSRSQIPQEVHRRHLAPLGGGFAEVRPENAETVR